MCFVKTVLPLLTGLSSNSSSDYMICSSLSAHD